MPKYVPTKAEIQKEIIRCGNDPSYFLKNYVKIVHPTKGLVPFLLYPFQEETLKKFEDHRFNIVLKSRQMGLSTLTSAYVAWFMLFQKNRNILGIATKLSVAVNLVRKVKTIFSNLPGWLVDNTAQISVDNKQSLELTNGSRFVASAKSEDAGRSEALSLLVVDECVAGSTKVTVRSKKTGEIREIEIQELYDLYTIKSITEWEVLTPSGWSIFSGVKKVSKKCFYRINTTRGELVCSYEHKLKIYDGRFMAANKLQVGQLLSEQVEILEIKYFEEDIELYDLLEVEKDHEFYANGIVSSNCAHIEGMSDIWTSIGPTITLGGRCIALSSPNGAQGWFYKYYVDGEAGRNDFCATKLHWRLHPDRDDEWFEKETRNMSKREVSQEYSCGFLSSGATLIDGEDIKRMEDSQVRDPVERIAFDRNLWIWQHYDPVANYLISADVARGDGEDYSVFHILRLDTMEVIGEYQGKLTPDLFADLLANTGRMYGGCMIVVENNNLGWMVANRLKDAIQYKNLYYELKGTHDHVDPIRASRNDKAHCGFNTAPNGLGNRTHILGKLEEFVRNRQITIRSVRLLNEMKTFIYKETGKAEAAKGYNDDLVMALAIACWVRETALTQNVKELAYAKALLTSIYVSTATMDTRIEGQIGYGSGHDSKEIMQKRKEARGQLDISKDEVIPGGMMFPVFVG